MKARRQENDLIRCTVLLAAASLLMLCTPGQAMLASASDKQQVANTGCELPQLSQDLITHQQWTAAIPALHTFLATHPTCADVQYTLGHVLLHADQPDASLRAFTEAAQMRPPTSSDFVAVASDYILLKSYDNAQRWLLQAVKTVPINSEAWYLLGRTQYNLDLNEAAIQSFQQSLRILPDDLRSEYNLGLAYERLQQVDLARATYLKAIAIDENQHLLDAQPYLDMGLLVRTQNGPKDALPYLQKAAELAPKNALVFQELGRTLYDLDRVDEAIAALLTSTSLAPSATPPHLFLGRAYRKLGKLHDADEQFALVQKLAGTKSIASTPNSSTLP